ncbi:MAG: cytochrome b N-terminal domain-containing protein [Desulfobacterota bacterium]|jgi:quinol-cytochrome oxidoreductase complex cytochrome b subunit|nr:cytochrome b N-terminal domain-containing protein [Thermodesulfobacteriota bacterium]
MAQQDEMPNRPNLFQRVLYSVFPGILRPEKVREGYRRLFNSLILHFRPRNVPEETLRWTLTWGLGGMAAVLVFLLLGTGVLLKFVYQPFADKAYESILYLQNQVLFGRLIRNIHHWSANALVLVVFLHLLRVFFTGAFHAPRQFNWVIGSGLLLLVLMSNFTGYLLPWDQLAFWAITICTGTLEYMPGIGLWLQRLIQGGAEVGPGTLTNFYAVHTAVLPASLLILMSFHFWRIRKAGGLVVPRQPGQDSGERGHTVPAIPNLLLREIVTALVLIACMLVFSMTVDAPLGDKANPGLSPNPTKAPWYFMGIQEMLLHFHPVFALFVIPMLMLVALLAIPYMDYQENTAGIWFASTKGRRMASVAALIAVTGTPLVILLDEYLFEIAARLPNVPGWLSNGLVPFALLLAAIAVFYVFMQRKYAASNTEAVQMVFVLLVAAFFVLTATGIGFRGEGMKLVWP